MVVPLPCPTLRSLVRGCIGAAAVLVCVVGCARPDSEPPPAVLPSVESVADRTVDPAEGDPPSVEVEQWPDDPEVRAAVEVYVAFEEAVIELGVTGASESSVAAARRYVDPGGEADKVVDRWAEFYREAGPVDAHGISQLSDVQVLDRQPEALRLLVCMDNSALHVDDPDAFEYQHDTLWMTWSGTQWTVHSLESEQAETC